MKHFTIWFVILPFGMVAVGCHKTSKLDGEGDAGVRNGSTETSTDTDGDTDTDIYSDTDADADTDTDIDENMDAGPDSGNIWGNLTNSRAFEWDIANGKPLSVCIPEESQELGEWCSLKRSCEGYKVPSSKIYCTSMVNTPVSDNQGKCSKHDKSYNWQGTVEEFGWYATKDDVPRNNHGFVSFPRVAEARVRYLRITNTLEIGKPVALTDITSDENGEFVKFARVIADPHGILAEVSKPGGNYFHTMTSVTHAPYVGGVDIKNIPILTMETNDKINDILEEEGTLGRWLPFGHKGGVIGTVSSIYNREPLAQVHLKAGKPSLKIRYLNADRKGMNEERTSDTGVYVALNTTTTPIMANAFVGGRGNYKEYKERRINCEVGWIIGWNGAIFSRNFPVAIEKSCKDWEDFVQGDCQKICQTTCPENEHWDRWW